MVRDREAALMRSGLDEGSAWHAVFRDSSTGIALTEGPGERITALNESFARMHGFEATELVGTALTALIVQRDELRSQDDTLQCGARVYRGVHRRRDGTRFPVEVEELSLGHDGALSVAVHVRDITALVASEDERRRFEEQVRHTQKLESLGVLAGGIAHDFNNLLMGILANTELALRRLPADAPARQNLEHARETALRAGELANQMLAYSGRGHFQVSPVALNDLVRELGDLLRVSLSKKVSLRYGFHPELPAIEGDPVQLRQVVMNLITNASDAIGDEVGVITVTTGLLRVDRNYLPDVAESTGEGEYVYVEVRDTGAGMSGETAAKIFEPFFTTKRAGRGLGLAAVFGILRGHRGAIKVHSRIGEGTSFLVLFPRTQALRATTHDSLRPTAPLSATILIAEDEARVRGTLAEMLRDAGCTVIEAADGRSALKLFDAQRDAIDAVLLDLTMPELSGRQVFAELQQRRPGLPVVVMSGYAQRELDQSFGEHPRLQFLQKPIPMQRLIDTLRAVLTQRGGA